MPVIFLTSTGAGSWSIPADWNDAANTIECIGGGGGGRTPGAAGGGGGGGGAYASVSNLNFSNRGNDSSTKVLLHFNGADGSTTITDENAGGSAHTWTAAGNAQIDTAQSKFGGASALFDGTGDWITTPDHADFEFGSSDFTVDAWFRCTATSGSAEAIIAKATDTFAAGWIIRRNTDNTIVVYAKESAASGGVFLQGTTQFTDVTNTGWHHVALTRSGNTWRLFIDGVIEDSKTESFSIADNAAVLAVGTWGTTGGADPWNGHIDEVRVSVGVARWTANFTPPTSPYVGSSISYSVGASGAAGNPGSAGGDTWFNGATLAQSSVGAQGGSGGNGATGGAGGASGSSVGTTTFSGGTGGNGGSTAQDGGGGGGGAAGPSGIGKNGGTGGAADQGCGGGGGGSNGGSSTAGGNANGATSGGDGGNGTGGTGGGAAGVGSGAGGNGTNGGGGGGKGNATSGSQPGGNGGASVIWTQTSDSATAGTGGGGGGGDGGNAGDGCGGGAGGLYGGGGGGAGDTASGVQRDGGAGAQGIIVITYTPAGQNFRAYIIG
jgi:hypothetical protein